MSFNGFHPFDKNLRKVMASDAFRKADPVQKMNLGHRLLNSVYGLGRCGVVKPLVDATMDAAELNKRARALFETTRKRMGGKVHWEEISEQTRQLYRDHALELEQPKP